MKYQFKNKELEKVIFALFDKESVMKVIAERMESDVERIGFANDLICYSTSLNKAFLDVPKLSVIFSFPKTEIEEIREFSPTEWNPYPAVKVPERKKYLVQILYKAIGKRSLSTALYAGDHWECYGDEFDFTLDPRDFEIVAFRELPEFYEPEK